MLPKTHLTSHSRCLALSDHTTVVIKAFLYSSVYSCQFFLISYASVRSLPFLSFFMSILAWSVPLISPGFLKRSLLFSILLFSSISLHCSFKKGFLSLDLMDYSFPGSSENSPGKYTGVGNHSLLQGTFQTQGSNPGLPHCRRVLSNLSHQESCRPSNITLTQSKGAPCESWPCSLLNTASFNFTSTCARPQITRHWAKSFVWRDERWDVWHLKDLVLPWGFVPVTYPLMEGFMNYMNNSGLSSFSL